MKRITLVFTTVLILIITSKAVYAKDKNDFLSNLISYSYPEVKVIEKNEDKSSEKTEKEDSNQYINVYVGEDNIPKTETQEVAVKDDLYKDNLRVTNKEPEIFIYHSHSCETYADSPAGNYHSDDKAHSVVTVGSLLTDELNKLGWSVAHSSKYHDSPTYNSSYQRSANTIKSVLNDYSSVKLTIDLHRDGLNIYNQSVKSNFHDKYTTTINGQKVAKFFFVVGARNSNLEKVKGLADDITAYAKEKYPDLIMPVVVKPYGRFNQSICENALLVEVGSNATTTEEAKTSTKYLAEILDGYFRKNNL